MSVGCTLGYVRSERTSVALFYSTISFAFVRYVVLLIFFK